MEYFNVERDFSFFIFSSMTRNYTHKDLGIGVKNLDASEMGHRQVNC